MDHLNTRLDDLIAENNILRAKLEEAEALIHAVRTGRVDALVVSGDKKEAVYTLKGADHTYRILIESINEGAVILSGSGTVLYCNQRFAEMLRKPISAITGTDILDHICGGNQRFFQNMHRRVFEKNGFRTEMQLGTDDAGIPALVSLSPLHTGDMQAVCMVVTDLSELKRSQQTLRAYADRLYRKNAELRHRAEQLARLSAELTMAEQRERKRVSKILHDGLQQHLAAAKLQLGGMAEQVDAPDLKQAALEIETMLGDSIRMARSLSADLSPPILHAGGIAAGLQWLARWMAEMHGFTVHLRLATDAVNIEEDVKILVFESVRELLFNAVKHAGVPQADICLEPAQGSRIKISVVDKGRGFDPEQLRLTDGNTCGLGLFSIRERIGLIGGVFDIDSAPGRGCRLTLTVPEAIEVPVDAVCESAEPLETRIGATEKPHQGPVVRVLLADDHTLFRDGIARLLSKESNIEVVGQAANGREAIELARKLNPHLILMDISMPEIDGVEATRIIHQQAPHIRIVGLSMYEDEERAQVMYDAGAVAYKTKTCPAAELIAAVLPNSNEPEAAPLQDVPVQRRRHKR